MGKSVSYFSCGVFLSFLFAVECPLRAQVSNPSAWESFVTSKDNPVVSDTFRLQTFGKSGRDNWTYRTAGEASLLEEEDALRLPSGSSATFTSINPTGYEDKPKIEYTKQTVWIVCKDGKFDTSTQEVYLEYIDNNQISEPSTLLIDYKDLFGMTIDDFNVKNTHIIFNVTSYDEYKKSALFMTNLREKYKGFDNFKIFIQVFESMITTRSSINGINLNTISDINKSPLAQFISYAVNED